MVTEPYTNGKTAKLANGHTVIPEKSSTESLSDEMESASLQPQRRPSSKRKLSSPLMPAFMVSAPGKVIVYGEHAVVHGKVGHHNRI
jgi:mevalonate kinase